jgi:hypothetical protein
MASPNRKAVQFGPKHEEYRKKVAHVLDTDFSEKKDLSTRERNGQYRRQAVEASMKERGGLRMPKSVGGLFSDPPLLGTSEAAVNWYYLEMRGAGGGGTPRDSAPSQGLFTSGERGKRKS